MIELQQLQLRRGQRCLLDNASLVIHPGDKVGIVGANGCGKSSFFQLLLGNLSPDQGNLTLPQGWRMSWVEQDTPAIAASVLDHALDGDADYRQIANAIADAESRQDGAQLGELHQQFELLHGYSAPARAARLLAGLGFDQQAQQRPVASFSGGWRMRINLARALLKPSDLLLLDEPTNHLDMSALLWLEQFLKSYQGVLLIISHDREFLDGLVQKIVHIDNATVVSYAGDYSCFERQRAERLSQQQALFSKQQQQRIHLQQFVDRFRAKATKARQAQSRIKALEKLTLAAPAYANSGYSFQFFEPESLASPLLNLEQVVAGYNGQPVLEHINLDLLPGSRIALLGHNGAGKSTLIKVLAGQLAPLSGRRVMGRQLRIGYFAQHQIEVLDMQASPLLHLQRLAPNSREQELRDYLGRFGFGGTQAEAPVEPFSGGEKTRLALALLIWQKPNLLLLDEPSNHLDIDMRQALVTALQGFTGAVILVSHDRYLLRTVVDRFYTVGEGRVAPFDGDLDDYQAAQYSEQRADKIRAADDAVGTNDRKQLKRREAELRQQLAPLKRALAATEKELATLEAQIELLDSQLAEARLYRADAQAELNQLLRQQGNNRRQLAELEEIWLEQQEALDRVAGAVGKKSGAGGNG